jgi:hypothetical protein
MTTANTKALIRRHQHLYYRIGVLQSSDDINGIEQAAKHMASIQDKLGMTEAEIQATAI